MALQSGLPPLDFGDVIGKGNTEYIEAVQAGMDRDYKLMEKVFEAVIRKTLWTREPR